MTCVDWKFDTKTMQCTHHGLGTKSTADDNDVAFWYLTLWPGKKVVDTSHLILAIQG